MLEKVCGNITGRAMGKIIKDTIHVNEIDIGIVSKSGRYGGTYAHSDIAMSFATWISPEFQLYIYEGLQEIKDG